MNAPVTALAHPNVALVKYWGKREGAGNLPAVGSLSITLGGLTTTTCVRIDDALAGDTFLLDGRTDPAGLARVSGCLDLFRALTGRSFHAEVDSRNDFPTSAGLASSASGFAALVAAVDRALGTALDRTVLAGLARRCSGSAARSLFGGFVEIDPGAGDGEPLVRQVAPPEAWPLAVVVAVTATEEKAVGSSPGMRHTAATSPYYPAWVGGSGRDLEEARAAVARRDFQALADVSEHSCLKMHGVMLAARPGLVYWSGATVSCLQLIRELRRDGLGVFFTIDAGPQVKAVCLPGAADRVAAELGATPGVKKILRSNLGAGAHVLGEAPCA